MQLRHHLIIYPQKHTCGEPDCLRVFASHLELKTHANLAKHRPYRCECGEIDDVKYRLSLHIIHANRFHSKNIAHSRAVLKDPHTCAEEGCHRVCPNGNKLQEHAKVTGHKAFQCVCSKRYSKLCSLGRHIDESRDDGEGQYKCPECPWSSGFKRLNHLEQHLRACHRRTTKEVKAILLPFRKRKAGTSDSALTAGRAAKQDAAQEGSSPSPPLDPFVGNAAAARTAFLAMATGAVPPTHDANITALTAGPAEGPALLDATPVDFSAGAPVRSMPLEGDGLPSLAPQWSDQLSSSFQTFQGTVPSTFHLNGSSHLARGEASSALPFANFNSYVPSTPYGFTNPSVHNLAPFSSPFGQSQVNGSMMEDNSLSLPPNYGTFISPTQPSSHYYPPLTPVLGQSISLNHGQMGSAAFDTVGSDLTAGQMPMGNMLGYHDVLPVSLANPTFVPIGLDNTEAYTQPLTESMDYHGLSEDLTAAYPYSQVFPGQAH